MAQEIATADSGGDIIESVIAKGDLARLTPQERTRYYVEVCKSCGVNPFTKPFEYITLNGKLTLYALRSAADQLRKINGISLEIVSKDVDGDLLLVHVRAKDRTGRTDEDFGAVSIAGLKGEARANAILKGITKGKRRVTLSISGLGFLDETEVEDIPSRSKALPVPTVAAELDSFAYNQETGEIDVAQPEPEPPLGDRATTAAGFGMKSLEDFWCGLSRDDKLALQPHLPALKDRAAKADQDSFGLPPSAPDRPAGSPPSVSPSDDAGPPLAPPGEPTPEHAAARDQQQPPSERKDDADRPVAARGSAETAPPRAFAKIIPQKRNGKFDWDTTRDLLVEAVGMIEDVPDVARWHALQQSTIDLLPSADQRAVLRAISEKERLLAMGDGR